MLNLVWQPMSERLADFLARWAPVAFDALLDREEVPRNAQHCDSCKADIKDASYTCYNSMMAPTLCAQCSIQAHRHSPFHILGRSTLGDRFPTRCTLDSLGLEICLGHRGEPCRYAINSRAMTVVHNRGVHDVHVRFCACRKLGESPIPDFVQLILVGIWPASWKEPRSAFTFDVMEGFHILSVQAHTNVYDFCKYLAMLTDDVFPDDIAVRFLLSSPYTND